MKRSRVSHQAKQTPDVEQLLRLSCHLEQSSCRAEDDFWITQLDSHIDRLLEERDETTLNVALDRLYDQRQEQAYDILTNAVESRSESRRQIHRLPAEGKMDSEIDFLLVTAPLLAWSRFTIPSGPIPLTVLTDIRTHLQTHVFADNVHIGLADFLFSPDQLPQGYCETADLVKQLSKPALNNHDLHIDPQQMPKTIHFLSDIRYLLGVVAVPRNTAIFRWQGEDFSKNDRDTVLYQWHSQGSALLRPLLPGCAYELLLPQSFHAGCRNADRLSRPYSLHASIVYISTLLNLAPSALCAIVAPFHEQQIEEYRIGFTKQGSSQIIYGAVWPLLDQENESEDMTQIETILREANLGEILILEHSMPIEYCDDCGAPLYPNPEGEPVHAELPEEQAQSVPQHMH